MASNWEAIAQKAQSERDAKIPAEWKIPQGEIDAAGDFGGLKLIESKLSPRELEITSMTAAQALKVCGRAHRRTCCGAPGDRQPNFALVTSSFNRVNRWIIPYRNFTRAN